MLRDETGRSNSVAVGVDEDGLLKQAIRRAQEDLYEQVDWPFLQTVFDRISLQAGDRYYDFPAGMSYDRLVCKPAVWIDSIPFELERGIGFEEYAVYDSESDARSEPATRWDVRWTGTEEQIEVWPVPSTNTQELQFIGIRKLRPLIAHADVADLDDQLIVLFAAADLIDDEVKAKKKLAAAQARFNRLKGNAKRGGKTYRMGMGANPHPDQGRVTLRISRN
jgi:hypothetical protein